MTSDEEIYKIEISDSALEQALKQGGQLRKEIVGGNIWAPQRYHEFEDEDAAFNWKSKLVQMDEGPGTFYLRSPSESQTGKTGDQLLVYRQD